MQIIVKMGIKNILRHKKRSAFLGASIVICVMILIITSSFAEGIKTVIVNQVIGTNNGHVSIVFGKNGSMFQSMVSNGERIREIIDEQGEDILEIRESISIMARSIGNKRSDNVMLTGITNNSKKSRYDFSSNVKIVRGAYERLFDGQTSNPAIISEEKATFLGVQVGDTVPVKFHDVSRHFQAARLTIVGVFKPKNFFLGGHVFIPVDTLKVIMGYRSFDICRLNLRVIEPMVNAKGVADRLHRILEPRIVAVDTWIGDEKISLLGLKNQVIKKRTNEKFLQVEGIEICNAFVVGEAAISKHLSDEYGLMRGDTIMLLYKVKGTGANGIYRFKVGGIFESIGMLEKAVLIAQDDFYELLWEKYPPEIRYPQWDSKKTVLNEIFCREWRLLDRCETEDQMKSQELSLMKEGEKGILVGVRSMYENAGEIILMSRLLTLISGLLVFVLLILICIGLVSTVQMIVRERIREIGMLRAVGMLKSEVITMLIAEKMALATGAIMVGIIISYLFMLCSGLVRLDVDGPVAMILLDGRLPFVSKPLLVFEYIVIIIGFVFTATFFPARAAGKIEPVESIMHYE